jgi:hypothetical protein
MPTSLSGAPFRTKAVVALALKACNLYHKNKALIDAFFEGDTLMLAMLNALDAVCGELIAFNKTDES